VRKQKRFTLMPIITLAALSLMVSIPMLSSVRLYAASAQKYTAVTVRPGDTLWAIAASHTTASGDVNETIDRITEVNHLHAASLQPGERLKIPE